VASVDSGHLDSSFLCVRGSIGTPVTRSYPPFRGAGQKRVFSPIAALRALPQDWLPGTMLRRSVLRFLLSRVHVVGPDGRSFSLPYGGSFPAYPTSWPALAAVWISCAAGPPGSSGNPPPVPFQRKDTPSSVEYLRLATMEELFSVPFWKVDLLEVKSRFFLLLDSLCWISRFPPLLKTWFFTFPVLNPDTVFSRLLSGPQAGWLLRLTEAVACERFTWSTISSSTFRSGSAEILSCPSSLFWTSPLSS